MVFPKISSQLAFNQLNIKYRRPEIVARKLGSVRSYNAPNGVEWK